MAGSPAHPAAHDVAGRDPARGLTRLCLAALATTAAYAVGGWSWREGGLAAGGAPRPDGSRLAHLGGLTAVVGGASLGLAVVLVVLAVLWLRRRPGPGGVVLGVAACGLAAYVAVVTAAYLVVA